MRVRRSFKNNIEMACRLLIFMMKKNILYSASTVCATCDYVVCVYVNSECNCGPYLDPKKMSQIPLTFGPDTIKRVLRGSIQHLVDASHDQKQVTSMLTQGDGRVIITALYEKKSSHFRLPEIEKVEEFWNFVANFLKNLMCCKNLFSNNPLKGPCGKCQNLNTTVKREVDEQRVSSKTIKPCSSNGSSTSNSSSYSYASNSSSSSSSSTSSNSSNSNNNNNKGSISTSVTTATTYSTSSSCTTPHVTTTSTTATTTTAATNTSSISTATTATNTNVSRVITANNNVKLKRRCSPESSSPSSPQSSNASIGSHTTTISSTVTPHKICRTVAEQEAATSTTQAEVTPKLPPDPADWSIENVISYISYSDPRLGVHADLFRRHEIDGKALLLLNSDTMMKYMQLKLGPALKICNLVSKIKTRRHVVF